MRRVKAATFYAGLALFLAGVVIVGAMQVYRVFVVPEMTPAAYFWRYPMVHIAGVGSIVFGGIGMGWGVK